MRYLASWTSLPFLLVFLLGPAAPASADASRELQGYRDYVLPSGGATPPGASGPGASGVSATAVAAAPDGSTLSYNDIYHGVQYAMLRFNGRHTALFIQRKDLEIAGLARVRKVIDEQDLLYEAMTELIGVEPGGSNDLLPVAIVDSTCGGASGCGFIGTRGVEIRSSVFHRTDYIEYVAHEMLHNFDQYSGYLYNGIDLAHAWTAFWDHFVPYFLHKAAGSLDAEDALRLAVIDKLAPYEGHPGANWNNCVLNVGCDPEGPVDPTGMALLTQGGVLLRIAQLHGRPSLRQWIPTLQGLITSRGLSPGSMTPSQKSDLFIESVGRAVGADVSCYFDGWNWPVGASVRSALAAFGTNAKCQDPDGDGRSEWAKDCRTNDAAVFPGAVETADGVDTDCDGAVDDLHFAEPGDFPGAAASATLVPLPRRVTGQIASGSDADFIRLNLPAPGWVRLTVKSLGFGGALARVGGASLPVDPRATEVMKLQLGAGDHVFSLAGATAGAYELIMQSDYALPMAEDNWPVTFTPSPATSVGADAYRIPTPPTPAAIAGLPGLTLHWWSSRLGTLGSVTPASAPHFDWNAPAGTDPERLVLRASYRSNGVPVHAFTQPQSLLGPTPWTTQDVGSVGVAGASANFGEEDFGLKASGADIWGTVDAFRFTWLRLNGNGEIRARVLHVQNTHEFAKAGVMFREDLTPGSKNVFAAMIAGNQFTFQRRVSAGGNSASTKVAGLGTPYWVRLTRAGDLFRAYRSADGSAWTEVGNVTLPMAQNAYVGLALTSHNNPVTAAASFDNVITLGGTQGGTLSITGRVTTSSGAGLSATAIAVTGTQSANATTDANGNYTVANLPQGGNYTVTPSRAGHAFSPESRSFTNAQANVVADFTGTPTGGGLPAPWLTQDIGNVALAGNATHASGTFTLTGAGDDIWNAADAFRFAYVTLSGDADLRARVSSVQNTDSWAKAAVMIREDLTPGSRNAAMVVSAASGLSFQYRTTAGGGSNFSGTPGAAPKWIRIVRSGSILAGYWSDNGTAWTQVGTISIPMAASVHLGLAVTSHNPAVLCQGVFTDVTYGTQWTRNDVGAVGLAGSGSVTGSSGSVTGSGADIWGAADAFTYLHRPIYGDGSITARVASVQNTNEWAKAGVMIRESLAPGSTHATMVVTPLRGYSFQRRPSAGGSSQATTVSGAAPRWVRVTRAGNVFTAFHSADGATWTQVGTHTIAMGTNVLMGLAVTSHNNAVLCQGVFDNISVTE